MSGAVSAPTTDEQVQHLRELRAAARVTASTAPSPATTPAIASLDGAVLALTPSALDAALCAARAGRRGAHPRALHLAASRAASGEALSPEPPAMTAVPHHLGDLHHLHHRLVGVQLDLERLLDRLDADGDLHAPLAALAERLHDLGDALLDTWRALGEQQAQWQCPSCRQWNSPRFDVCWNCDRRRPRPRHSPAEATLIVQLPTCRPGLGSLLR